MKKKYAIIYLSFSRLEKVKYFFQQIKKNPSYSEYSFYIFSDHGRNLSEQKKILKVREFLETLNIKKKLIFYNKNIGTNLIFSKSLTKVFEDFEYAVLFEEDIIPNHHTLKYFDEAFKKLDVLKNVGLITAHSLLNSKKAHFYKNLFISRRSNIWGLGISKKIFNQMIFNPTILKKEMIKKNFEIEKLRNFDDNIYSQVLKFLYSNKELNQDIMVLINSLLLEKYTLTPNKSLVLNAGIDGSGERAKKDSFNFINETFNENNSIDFGNTSHDIKMDQNYEKFVKTKFSYGLLYKIVKKIKKFFNNY